MKSIGKVVITVILIIIFIGISNHSFAEETFSDYMDDFKANEKYIEENGKIDSITDIISDVLGILQLATGLISIIIIAVTGFRVITETPSVKTELKRTMTSVVIGAILVFSALSIARFMIKIFEKASA